MLVTCPLINRPVGGLAPLGAILVYDVVLYRHGDCAYHSAQSSSCCTSLAFKLVVAAGRVGCLLYEHPTHPAASTILPASEVQQHEDDAG